MSKTRINVSLDKDLAEFAKIFAAENRTTVADMVTQYLLVLKRRVEGEYIDNIFAHPAFQQAMEETQDRLRTGSAQWHSYDEVFGD
ncbi:MAG: DUF6364 family protein [Desulfobacteraceae bacterium]|nr:DUF6364 family protein [Desulfobacteraceae bacterium]